MFVVVQIANSPLLSSTSDFNAVLLEYSQPDDEVLIINTHCCPMYPGLQQVERRQASRYLAAYPLAFGYFGMSTHVIMQDNHIPPPLVQQYLIDLEADIRQSEPPLILIYAEECTACPPDFNIHTFLGHVGFIDAVILPNYEERGNVEGFQIYVLRETIGNT